MSETRTPRRVLLETVRDLARQVRGGAYFVKRGWINWPAFNFQDHPIGFAIMMDHTGPHPSLGRVMQLSLELAGQIPAADQHPSLDDGFLEDLIQDVEWVAVRLAGARNGEGDAVAFKLSVDNILEWHDADNRLQGVVAILTVGY